MSRTRVCESCGQEYGKKREWSYAYFARRRFCSQECAAKRRPSITSDYAVDAVGCHVWQGYVDRNGYGRAYDANQPPGKRFDWAHRVAYRTYKGEIPPRHEIDHLCENTRCVNPDHLEAVTKVEHVRRTFDRMGYSAMQLGAVRMRQAGLTYAEIGLVAGLSGRERAHAVVKSAIRKGLVNAEDVPTASHVTDEDRQDIRALYALGVPQTELAAWYGLDSSQISRICNGMRSGHDRGAA